jgi:hypothetical protein
MTNEDVYEQLKEVYNVLSFDLNGAPEHLKKAAVTAALDMLDNIMSECAKSNMEEDIQSLPQFDRKRNGSLYDRGSADSYYGRSLDPHWYPNGTYNAPKMDNLSATEIAEYVAGYNANQQSGNRKWL